jgi:hypothetical protein
MPRPSVLLAAWNNSQWCDALCAAHDGPGELHPTHWLKRGSVPPYVPKVVTLDGPNGAETQQAAIRSLSEAEPAATFAVKDSFQSLDLVPLGLEVLFTATWIALTADDAVGAEPGEALDWSAVTTPAGLAEWEAAWRASSANADLAQREPVFPPQLLAAPGVHFLAGRSEGETVATAVLNRTGDVVGLSNVFSARAAAGALFPGCIRAARRLYPGLPLVGYQAGAALEAALGAGFVALRGLTVWLRSPGALV